MASIKILILLCLVALAASSPTFGHSKWGLISSIFTPHQREGRLASIRFVPRGIVSVKAKLAIDLFGKLSRRKKATSLSHVWNTALIAAKASGGIIDAWSPGVGSLFVKIHFGFLKIGVCVLGKRTRSICKRSYGKNLGFKEYRGGYGSVDEVLVALELQNANSLYLQLLKKNGHGDIESLKGTAKIVAKSIQKLTLLLQRGAKEWKHEDLLVAYAELTVVLGIFGKSCHKDLGLTVAVDFLEYAKSIFSSSKKWNLDTYSADIKKRITNAEIDNFYGIFSKVSDDDVKKDKDNSDTIEDDEDDKDTSDTEISESSSSYNAYSRFLRGIDKSKAESSYTIFRYLSRRRRATSLSHVWNHALLTARGVGGILNIWSPGVGTLFNSLYIALVRIGVCVLSKSRRSVCKPNYGKRWGWKPYTKGYSSIETVISAYELKDVSTKFTLLLKKNGHEIDSLKGVLKVVANSIKKLTLLINRDVSSWKQEDLITIYGQLGLILGSLGKKTHRDLGSTLVDQYFDYSTQVFKSQRNWDLTETRTTVTKTVTTTTITETTTITGIKKISDEEFSKTGTEETSTSTSESTDANDDEDDQDDKASKGGNDTTPKDGDKPKDNNDKPQDSKSKEGAPKDGDKPKDTKDTDSDNTPQLTKQKKTSTQIRYNAYSRFLRGIDKSKAESSYTIFRYLSRRRRATSLSQVWNHALITARGVGGILNLWSPGVGTLFNSLYIALVRIGVCVVSKSGRSVCNPSYGKKWGWKPYTKGYSSIETVISAYELKDVSTKFTLLLKKNGHEIDSLKGVLKVVANSIKKLTLLINRDVSSWKQEDLITIYGQLGLILGSLGKKTHRDLGSTLVDQYFEYSTQIFKSQRNWDLTETKTTVTKTVTTTTTTETTITGIKQITDEEFSKTDTEETSTSTSDSTDANADDDDQDYGNDKLKDAAPKESAPKDSAPKESAPKNSAPKDSAPQDAAPKDSAPKDSAPQESAPKDSAPKDSAPKDSAPKDSAPQESAPKESAPEDAAPKDAAPKESAPEDAAPKDAAPKDSAPKDSAPQESAPKDSAPQESAPKESAPQDAAPKDSAPKESAPKDAGSEGTESKDTGSEVTESKYTGSDGTESKNVESEVAVSKDVGTEGSEYGTTYYIIKSDNSEDGSQNTGTDSDSSTQQLEVQSTNQKRLSKQTRFNAYSRFLRGIDKSKAESSYTIFRYLSRRRRATSMSQVWNHALITARGVGGILNLWSPGVGTLFNSLYIALVRIGVCVLSKSRRSVCNPSYGKRWGWKPYTKGYSSIETVISAYELKDVSSKFTLLLKKNGHEIDSLKGVLKVVANSIKKLTLLINRDVSSWKQEDLITIYGQLGVILGSLGKKTHRDLGSILVDQYFDYSAQVFKSERNWDLAQTRTTVTKTVTTTTITETTITGIKQISDKELVEAENDSSTNAADTAANDDEDDKDYVGN